MAKRRNNKVAAAVAKHSNASRADEKGKTEGHALAVAHLQAGNGRSQLFANMASRARE